MQMTVLRSVWIDITPSELLLLFCPRVGIQLHDDARPSVMLVWVRTDGGKNLKLVGWYVTETLSPTSSMGRSLSDLGSHELSFMFDGVTLTLKEVSLKSTTLLSSTRCSTSACFPRFCSPSRSYRFLRMLPLALS